MKTEATGFARLLTSLIFLHTEELKNSSKCTLYSLTIQPLQALDLDQIKSTPLAKLHVIAEAAPTLTTLEMLLTNSHQFVLLSLVYHYYYYYYYYYYYIIIIIIIIITINELSFFTLTHLSFSLFVFLFFYYYLTA